MQQIDGAGELIVDRLAVRLGRLGRGVALVVLVLISLVVLARLGTGRGAGGRLALWIETLNGKGIALAPVSEVLVK